ncbi:MAG: hypothetical protein ABII27_06875 [bacterium]
MKLLKRTVKRFYSFILAVIAILIFSVVFLYLTANQFLIPKIILPQLRQYLNHTFGKNLIVEFKDVKYNFVEGFVINNFSIKSKLPHEISKIIYVPNIQIDLEWIRLFMRSIVVSRCVLENPEVSIIRSKSVDWNIRPILNINLFEEKKTGKFSFRIRKLELKDGTVEFTDTAKENNSLKLNINRINARLINKLPNLYHVYTSVQDIAGGSTSLEIFVEYDKRARAASGKVTAATDAFGGFWGYYIDDIVKPWDADADVVKLDIGFIYKNNSLKLTSEAALTNGCFKRNNFQLKGAVNLINQMLFVNNIYQKEYARTEAELIDGSIIFQERSIVDNAVLKALINQKIFKVEELNGTIKYYPISLTGSATLSMPYQINLSGTISNFNADIKSTINNNKDGIFKLICKKSDSYINLGMQFKNLEELEMTSNLLCKLNMEDLKDIFKNAVFLKKVDGDISILGLIDGSLKFPSSLGGEINIEISEFSYDKSAPQSINIQLNGAEGVFRGTIPETSFFSGSLRGLLQADFNKWGIELHLNKVDLEAISKGYNGLNGLSGMLNSDIAAVAPWADCKKITGKGYVFVNKSYVGKYKLFNEIEDLVNEIIPDKGLSEFDTIELNFSVGDKKLTIENSLFSSKLINMSIMGDITFEKKVNLIAGIQIFTGAVAGALRKFLGALIPFADTFDFRLNVMQIEITGTMPKLKKRAQKKPLKWLTEFFKIQKIKQNKLSLKELWN